MFPVRAKVTRALVLWNSRHTLYKGFKLEHVWALKDANIGIDIRGIHHECLLAALANDGRAATAEDVDVEIVKALVGKKKYSSKRSMMLNKLADEIVNTHERFKDAKPEDKKENGSPIGKYLLNRQTRPQDRNHDV